MCLLSLYFLRGDRHEEKKRKQIPSRIDQKDRETIPWKYGS